MDIGNLPLFLVAALLIAVSPGPGLLYVAARTLSGGRKAGLASSFGTGLGGMVHILAGALGVSALLMASAEAFTLLKVLGALYLVWLGIRTIRQAHVEISPDVPGAGAGQAFREGIIVEALNPKTAAFFLAFIPQFVDPSRGDVALQFATFGLISVALNTLVDVVVTFIAARARDNLSGKPRLIRRLRQGSGMFICGLGASLALARRTA